MFFLCLAILAHSCAKLGKMDVPPSAEEHHARRVERGGSQRTLESRNHVGKRGLLDEHPRGRGTSRPNGSAPEALAASTPSGRWGIVLDVANAFPFLSHGRFLDKGDAHPPPPPQGCRRRPDK